ncbi:MAG: encapsulin, partial [Acidimicrobiales bacterium]
MSHLMRDKAPITDAAWAQIDAEATRSLTHFLAGRKLVDFSGPHGYAMSSLDLGRTSPAHEVPGEGVRVAVRESQPLVELRREFEIPWA